MYGTYDGKVDWADLSRFACVDSGDEGIVLYSHVVNHVHFKRNVRVVKVVDTHSNRWALLFSTDVALAAETIYRYYKARFQIEFIPACFNVLEPGTQATFKQRRI